MLAGDPYSLARVDHSVPRFQSVNTQGRLGGRMALPLLARCDRRLLRRFNKKRELLRLSWLLRIRLAGSAPVASRARICRGRAMDTSRHTSTALHANKPAGERRCRGRALRSIRLSFGFGRKEAPAGTGRSENTPLLAHSAAAGCAPRRGMPAAAVVAKCPGGPPIEDGSAGRAVLQCSARRSIRYHRQPPRIVGTFQALREQRLGWSAQVTRPV